MKFVSLFAGIGGFDLGLERAGHECVGQVEIDPYCTRVLAKHWPEVPRHDDVRTFQGTEFGPFDLLTGGYPCQPFSVAGNRAGESDERHLWPEVHRIIRNVRPAYVFLENVPGHLSLGFGRVLGDLAESGYDAEWDCIPATAVGAPHRRDRLWIVAYPARDEQRGVRRARQRVVDGSTGPGGVDELGTDTPQMADAQGQRRRRPIFTPPHVVNNRPEPTHRDARTGRNQEWWATEPDVGRVAHGVPARMDRLRTLGNAVVPQVAELIGRRLPA
jgi:DNA (cytosine-5)-methyltransferase 1